MDAIRAELAEFLKKHSFFNASVPSAGHPTDGAIALSFTLKDNVIPGKPIPETWRMDVEKFAKDRASEGGMVACRGISYAPVIRNMAYTLRPAR